MPNTLNVQYPLSPRKFWKKIIGQIIPLALLGGVCALFVGVFGGALTNPTIPNFLMYGLVGFAIFFGVPMVLYAWYVKAYIRRYFYDADENYITIKKGVFAPGEIHVQYSKIQDVYVDQDILDRIMGLYDVHLASATMASGMEAHIDGVEQAAADGLKDFLLQKLQHGGESSPSTNPIANNAPTSVSGPVSFDKEISIRTYPITGAWYVQQILVWFFTSIFYAAIIVLYVSGRENSFLSATMALPGFVALFIVIFVFHLIYMVLWRSTFSFNFLPDYIVTKQGVIAKTENHLPYRSVQDVAVSQGIIERMLGIATVRIENAAAVQMVGKQVISSAVKIPGQPLVQANELSEAVKKVALTRNSSRTGL